ncbi:MAG: hypothetical protein M1484_04670 [Patescibacteria group bacterium]|nr:hypothetical protein [Patescibacteria group bacterium]
MKKFIVVGLLLLVLLLVFEYLWFKGTMRCVINRSQSGQIVDWELIKDCSY